MPIQSRLLILAVKPDQTRKFDVGDIISVQPADYEPSPEVAHKMLIIDSEKTVAENKALAKGGVPESVLQAWRDEDERVRTAIVAKITAGRLLGLTDAQIMVLIKRDIVFDPSKEFNYNDYPKKSFKIDMSIVPQETLDRIDAGHAKLASVKSDAMQKERQRAQEKYAEHLERPLTQEERQMKTEHILSVYKPVERGQEMAALSPVEAIAGGLLVFGEEAEADLAVTENDIKADEITTASRLGREEIEHAALAEIAKPEPLVLTDQELDSAIINKHG